MSKIFDPQSKVLANFDVVRQLLEGRVNPPVLVEIDPSNTCNHACKFCCVQDTMIATNLGNIQFKDLNKDLHMVKGPSGKYLKIEAISQRPITEYQKIVAAGIELKITAEHDILTTRGWVKAKDIVAGDLFYVNENFSSRTTDSSAMPVRLREHSESTQRILEPLSKEPPKLWQTSGRECKEVSFRQNESQQSYEETRSGQEDGRCHEGKDKEQVKTSKGEYRTSSSKENAIRSKSNEGPSYQKEGNGSGIQVLEEVKERNTVRELADSQKYDDRIYREWDVLGGQNESRLCSSNTTEGSRVNTANGLRVDSLQEERKNSEQLCATENSKIQSEQSPLSNNIQEGRKGFPGGASRNYKNLFGQDIELERDLVLRQVDSNFVVVEDEVVYNLTCHPDNAYYANGIVVHNCISSYIHLPESKDLETYNKDILPKVILDHVIEDLYRLGVKAINWTGGGEPTVNPNLAEAIELAFDMDIKQGMFTNGTLLHKNNLIEAVVCNLDWIRVSVDAGKPETYNSVRRTREGHGWDRMVANLADLLSSKKLFGSDIDIGVGFVITPTTANEIVDFAKFFTRLDLTYCQFKPEIVNREREGGIQRDLDFWNNEVSPRLKEAEQILGDKFQINGYKLDDLVKDPTLYGRTYKKCLGSQISPCVGADGNVYVCTNHRGYKQYSYGSLYEKSFLEIWRDIATRQRIMDLIENKEGFANCTKLCKPHESNKMLWSLYEEYNGLSQDARASWLDQMEQDYQNIDIKHKEFI